ncbi:hypothetical protein Pmani_007723 [Petrolisthes manimaculis]|uniref:Uncharacterized protein n=1 Tax=Petrolisthes manimaculis TaxID=1843537 RepID=A0AAE1Q8A3_9EUCA|nr:hypothetical protein Pmani_007723 [Petrolisthes manimaculis]
MKHSPVLLLVVVLLSPQHARTQKNAPNQDSTAECMCDEEGMDQRDYTWNFGGWTWVAVVLIMILVAVLAASYFFVLQYRNQATVAEKCLKEKLEEGKEGPHEMRFYDVNNT